MIFHDTPIRLAPAIQFPTAPDAPIGQSKCVIRISRSPLAFLLIVLLVSGVLGCSHQYTSKDLAMLPCEHGETFFFPVEFNEKGKRLYPDQVANLRERLQGKTVSDVYVFVHGWNKTAAVAESEYQDFICRFYTRSDDIKKQKRIDDGTKQPFIIVGIFWPSTLFPDIRDPIFLKPISYFPIRNRADELTTNGFQDFLGLFEEVLGINVQDRHFRLHLIGHSFGGRIIANGLLKFLNDRPRRSRAFLDAFEKLDLILLLPAMSRNALYKKTPFIDFRDDEAKLRQDYSYLNPILNSQEVRSTIAEFLLRTNESEELPVFQIPFENLSELLGRFHGHLHIVVIHSSNDSANGYLFPIASLFTSDQASCGLGACGSPKDPTFEADDSGKIINPASLKEPGIVNVDASSIIFSHTDIFKGRVMHLLWQIFEHIGSLPKSQLLSEQK